MRRIIPAFVTALLVVTAGCAGVGGLGATGDATTDATNDVTNDATNDETNDAAMQGGTGVGDGRTVTVSADGRAAAAPDRAVVRLAVEAEGDDPSAIRDQLSSGIERLRSSLSDAGVSEGQVRTTDYEVRRVHPREREEVEYEYRGRHALEVTLDDPDAVGDVIDAAADSDATVGDVRFTLSDERRTELRDRALENAMDDARQQAETVAATEGLAVTRAAHIDASQRHYRPVRYDAAAAGGDGGGTSVSTGDVSVTVQVQVTYNATES